MGKRTPELQPDQIAFIGEQNLYFVGTAAPGTRVNLLPKGMDSLRILTPNRILWLNLSGSGNETAAHLALDPRIRLMWCSFTARPFILRAYGTARALYHAPPDWPDLITHLPEQPGARQIIEVTIDLVQSSCGYAVPFLDHREDRPVLRDWAADKDADGLRSYWSTRNRQSIDGLPTGIEANL